MLNRSIHLLSISNTSELFDLKIVQIGNTSPSLKRIQIEIIPVCKRMKLKLNGIENWNFSTL